MKTLYLVMSGKVQGVGYQDWLVRQAQRLGFAGWVRNRGDYTVEAVIAGEPQAVETCLGACQRGPTLEMVKVSPPKSASVHRSQLYRARFTYAPVPSWFATSVAATRLQLTKAC